MLAVFFSITYYHRSSKMLAWNMNCVMQRGNLVTLKVLVISNDALTLKEIHDLKLIQLLWKF